MHDLVVVLGVIVLLVVVRSLVIAADRRGLQSRFRGLRVSPVDSDSYGSVVVFTVSEGYRPFAEYTIARAQEYCDRHGYVFETLVLGRDFQTPTVAPQWYKIPATLAMMDKYPRASAYLWLDDDVYITNIHRTPSSVLGAAPKKSVFVGRDLSETVATRPGNMINTGVMLFRNTDEARAVVEKVWDHATSGGTYAIEPYHEQTILGGLCLEPWFRDQIAVTEIGVLQSYVHKDTPQELRWTPGDFAVHVCAETAENRERIFQNLQCGDVCTGLLSS